MTSAQAAKYVNLAMAFPLVRPQDIKCPKCGQESVEIVTDYPQSETDFADVYVRCNEFCGQLSSIKHFQAEELEAEYLYPELLAEVTA